MKYADIAAWLENDAQRNCVVEDGRNRENLVKVPYDADFDFIYHQSQHGANKLSRTQAFYYCGLYNKLDGMVYDLQGPLEGHLTELDSGKDLHLLNDDFKTAVCQYIKNIVDDNIDNLRSPFFENDKYQHSLDNFKEYNADSVIRQRFLNGETSDDVTFKCDYDCDRFEEAQMIRYLKYPTAAVEEAATEYWQTHQDDMLLTLYMNEHIKDCLEKLEAREDTRFHRQKDIIEAVSKCEAKSVNVTIQRDGKDFSFKYSAFNLKSNVFTDYQAWDMPTKDRLNFRNMFDEGSRFYPQEITAITYRGKTIYEAEPWGVGETPVEVEGSAMKM